MAFVRALARLACLALVLCLHVPPTLLAFLAARAPLAALGLRGSRLGPRVQASWGRWSLRAAGVRLEVEGVLPRGPLLVVSNHLSWLDIPVLAAVFGGRFVAKAEIARWPVVGPLASSVGTIFLERSRTRHVLDGGAAMKRSLARGCPVIVFPEGSNDRGERVRPFKSSMLQAASELSLPCLPVALGYSTPGTPWAVAFTVCWWGAEPLPRHMWHMLRIPRIVAHVRFTGEPLEPADRKQLAALAQARVTALFEPVSQTPPPPWRTPVELPDTGPIRP